MNIKQTITGVVILVVLSGAITVMASKGLFKKGNTEPVTLERTLTASNAVTSWQFTGDGILSFVGMNPLANPYTGEEPIEQEYNILFTLHRAGQASEDSQEMSLNMSFDLSELMEEMIIDLDARILSDNTIYFKANELPQLGVLSLDPFEGQWVRISLDDIIKQMEGIASQGEIESLKKQWETNFNLALQKQLGEDAIQLILESGAMKLGESCGSQRISGVATTCYSIDIDLVAFFTEVVPRFTEIVADNREALGLSDDEISQVEQETTSLLSEIQNNPEFIKVLDSITISTFELWLGKHDALPYRIVLDLQLNLEEGGETFSGRMRFAGDYRDYNKAIIVEAPEGSVSLEEFLQQLLGNIPGLVPPSGSPSIDGAVLPNSVGL